MIPIISSTTIVPIDACGYSYVAIADNDAIATFSICSYTACMLVNVRKLVAIA